MAGIVTRTERHDGTEWVFRIHPDGHETLWTKRQIAPHGARGWSHTERRKAAIRNRS